MKALDIVHHGPPIHIPPEEPKTPPPSPSSRIRKSRKPEHKPEAATTPVANTTEKETHVSLFPMKVDLVDPIAAGQAVNGHCAVGWAWEGNEHPPEHYHNQLTHDHGL